MKSFKEILKSMPTGLIVINFHNGKPFINDQAKMLLNIESQLDDQIVLEKFYILIADKKKEEFQISCNGKILYITSKKNKRSTSQQIYSISDITEMHLLYTKEATAALKRKLLLSFSHEFRTPIHEISFALFNLLSKENDMAYSESNKESINQIQNATLLLTLYVNDIEYFNKGSDNASSPFPEIQPLNIKKCITSCITFGESLVKSGKSKCKFHFEYPPNVPEKAYTDIKRFEQVFKNFFSNSIHSLSNKIGIISIYAHVDKRKGGRNKYARCDTESPKKKETIRVGISNNEIKHSLSLVTKKSVKLFDNQNPFMLCTMQIIFDIVDNCNPLTEKEIEMILNPCQYNSSCESTRNQFGMMICRQLCQNLGGDLSVVTSLKGNRYSFSIPYNPNDTIILVEEGISDVHSCTASLVMLVDDTMLCNKAVGMILSKIGVLHDSCFSGIEAIEKIKQYGNSIPIKLILMDINMPEMNGIEV